VHLNGGCSLCSTWPAVAYTYRVHKMRTHPSSRKCIIFDISDEHISFISAEICAFFDIIKGQSTKNRVIRPWFTFSALRCLDYLAYHKLESPVKLQESLATPGKRATAACVMCMNTKFLPSHRCLTPPSRGMPFDINAIYTFLKSTFNGLQFRRW